MERREVTAYILGLCMNIYAFLPDSSLRRKLMLFLKKGKPHSGVNRIGIPQMIRVLARFMEKLYHHQNSTILA